MCIKNLIISINVDKDNTCGNRSLLILPNPCEEKTLPKVFMSFQNKWFFFISFGSTTLHKMTLQYNLWIYLFVVKRKMFRQGQLNKKQTASSSTYFLFRNMLEFVVEGGEYLRLLLLLQLLFLLPLLCLLLPLLLEGAV